VSRQATQETEKHDGRTTDVKSLEVGVQISCCIYDLAKRKGCEIEEGHVMSDHVHMLIAIPPKYAVSQVIGYMKGKAAIYIARNFAGRKRNFVGQHFWARGYFVSTVGRDEEVIRQYIKNQEAEEVRLDQLNLL